MSATETIQPALSQEDMLFKCHQDGRDVGRKVLALLHGAEARRSSFHFMTEEADCHLAQHQGFMQALGIELDDDSPEPRVVKGIGDLVLIRESVRGAQVGPEGELTELHLGWDYRIESVEQAISAESA